MLVGEELRQESKGVAEPANGDKRRKEGHATPSYTSERNTWLYAHIVTCCKLTRTLHAVRRYTVRRSSALYVCMHEFPLVSVLRDVSVVRLTRVSCSRSPFCVGDIECVTSESLPGKHIPDPRET